jgi:signal transduction histidine kinase/CheY-like chemotaxis protein
MSVFRRNSGPKRRVSLSRRLVGLVLAAVGTGMVVSAVVFAWQQSVQYAESRREVLLATAHVFSAAVASSARDRDPSGAFAAIRAIGNLPDILYAEVQTTDGSVLATLGSAPRLVGDFTLDGNASVFGLFSSRTVEVSVSIVYGGEPAGRLVLIGGTAGLWDRLIESVAITALGGLMALIVGLLVAWRFQRGITNPLRQLMRAMADIRERHRYDLSVDDAGDREIGMLVDGFNAMLSDIRERDARLDAHRRNLEQEVADRTRDLREARDAADTANRAKSEFLATMSHEIRTPMNGIMVMAELLANTDMPRRQRRYAEVIAHSGQSLLAIINDILDLSKIESGKFQLESMSVDVTELADTVVSLFAERAHSKNIDLAALVDPTTPRQITGDLVRLTQIVSNLVNNALKFTDSGFVHLTIGPATARQGLLRIAVSDTGNGIPAEKVESIFEAFSQADQSTTRHYGGTGLGLAICKRLTVAMGGHIEVSSAVGTGSTFAVTIPVGEATEFRPWPRLDQGPDGPGLSIIDLAGEATALTASRYFAAFGYSVISADERLAGTQHANVGLVCVDAERLPTLELGRRDHRKPIVVAAARFGDDSGDRLVAEGLADAVITKPLLRSEIEDLLARIAAGESVLTLREAGDKHRVEPEFRGLKVLVADDSAVNREVAIEALSRLGAMVETVENGAQAIEAARNAAFDIVLMDGSMPDIDGFTAARAIRAMEASEQRDRLPIVALTAHVVGTSAEAWRDAGMDEVVYKPFTLAQLTACLRRLFPGWSAQHLSDSGQCFAEASGENNKYKPADLLDAGLIQELLQMAARGHHDFLRRVFDLYQEHAPRAVDEIVRTAQAKDSAVCGQAAHSLKSMSYNVGAAQVAARAEAIEHCAREKAEVPDSAQLQQLANALEATLAKIATLEVPPQTATTWATALAEDVTRQMLIADAS